MKKVFRVSGICFVPTECTMHVAATSKEEAVKIAVNRKDWKQGIDQNGGEYGSAFDWQPFAEQVEGNPDDL